MCKQKEPASAGSPESCPGPPTPGLLCAWGGVGGWAGGLPAQRLTSPARARPYLPPVAPRLCGHGHVSSVPQHGQPRGCRPTAGPVAPVPRLGACPWEHPGTGPRARGCTPCLCCVSLLGPSQPGDPAQQPGVSGGHWAHGGAVGLRGSGRSDGGTARRLEAHPGRLIWGVWPAPHPCKWSLSGVGVSDSGLWALPSLPSPSLD